jgi:tetratricopeptide (TPR) repeat protein
MSVRREATVVVWLFAALAGMSWYAVTAAQELPSGQPAVQPTLHELFVRGNQLYEAGDFEGAVEAYEETVSRGAVAPELFYNLGNAYYKSGELGRAVLNYERSLRLSPRNDDVKSNLQLVRSLLRDRQFVEEPGVVGRTASWLYGRLSARESLLLTSLLYLALIVVAIFFVFRDSAFVSRVYAKVSLLSPGRFLGLNRAQDFALAMAVLAVLLVAAGGTAYDKYRDIHSRRAAIVVKEEVPVYSGPNTDSTLQFKIHEGTRISTGEARPGWIQIRLPGDLSGWIAEGSMERI